MYRNTTLSMIAAVARNGAIGKDNALSWTDPEDLKHLRRVTMGCPVIMGRKTWDSLPERFRPLPGRRNLVVTRDVTWRSPGAESAASMEDALAMLGDVAKAFVIGGAQMYTLALPLVDELVLTEVDAEPIGDTFFPVWDRSRYSITSRQTHVAKDGTGFAFVTYTKKTGD
jgi:dihydrofolate reductase